MTPELWNILLAVITGLLTLVCGAGAYFASSVLQELKDINTTMSQVGTSVALLIEKDTTKQAVIDKLTERIEDLEKAMWPRD